MLRMQLMTVRVQHPVMQQMAADTLKQLGSIPHNSVMNTVGCNPLQMGSRSTLNGRGFMLTHLVLSENLELTSTMMAQVEGFEVYQCYMQRVSRNIIDDLTRARRA